MRRQGRHCYGGLFVGGPPHHQCHRPRRRAIQRRPVANRKSLTAGCPAFAGHDSRGYVPTIRSKRRPRLPALFAPCEPLFIKIFICTAVCDPLEWTHPHPQRGARPSESERGWGAAPAPAVSLTAVPGVLGWQPPGPIRGPGSMSLTPVGHQGLKTPQWSAVRRAGFARPAPVLRKGQASRVRPAALCSLAWE